MRCAQLWWGKRDQRPGQVIVPPAQDVRGHQNGKVAHVKFFGGAAEREKSRAVR